MNTSQAGLSILSLGNGPLSAPPAPHLRDPRPPSIMSILDPALKRASLQKALSAGQHWRSWAMPPEAAGGRPGS